MELSLHKEISGGLLITMVAFTAVAAEVRLSQGGTVADGETLAEAVAEALANHAKGWLLQKGGWEAMCPGLQFQHAPGDPAYETYMTVIVILGTIRRLFLRTLRTATPRTVSHSKGESKGGIPQGNGSEKG